MMENHPPTDRQRPRLDAGRDGRAEGRTRYRNLRTEATLYRGLVDTIRDPVVIADTDRCIVDCNPAFADRFGYSIDEVAGERVDILYADAAEFDAVTEELVTYADDPTFTPVIVYETRTGGTFPGETDIISIRDDTGELVAVISLIRDISDRRDRERARERTIEFLQGLYDVATDGESSAGGKIARLLELGPTALDLPYGYLTRIEAAGADGSGRTQRVIEAGGNHELLQPGNSCPLAQSYCRKTIETDGLLEVHDAIEAGWEGDPAYELFGLGCYLGTSITVDGELYGTVFFAATDPREEPFSDAARTFLRLMSQLVSYELKRDRARCELQRQNERLEEFTSIVSHDLRNPLNVARGYLELTREGSDDEHLANVARAHERMGDLIDDVLALARHGTDAIDVEPVHLGECSRACWQNVETAAATLVVDADRTVPADRSQLQQLLENLYRNAVEHGGDDVTVTVGTRPDRFYVEDDGAGIPEVKRDAVFEAGYSTNPEGTGFGLRIVKQVAEAHGWEVGVTDGADGGARFEVTGVQFATE